MVTMMTLFSLFSLFLAMTVKIFLISMFILILFLLARIIYDTLCFYWLTPLQIKRVMEKQGIRGPKPRFLLGNLPDMAFLLSKSISSDMPSISHNIVSRLIPHFVVWSSIYGNRFIYWSGTEPRLCVTEGDMIKELMTKYTTKSGKSWQQKQGNKHFIGRGLLMANGQDWLHQRHTIAPSFMGDKLKSYAVYMVECTEQVIENLEKMVESGQSVVEISQYMSQITVDVISRIEFGSNYKKGKQIFDLLTTLQHLVPQSNRNFCLPGSRFLPNKYNREIKSLKMEVERLLMEIVKSRGLTGMGYGNDLLGRLLDEMQKQRHKGNFNYNLQLIMDECKTFFFAGHDTTAVLLTWTIMLLASNPIWQDKVRTEVKQVTSGGTITMDHLSKFNLLEMVINESLRLYPPATVMPRMAFEDIKLGDLLIPKGLSIWIPVLAIHHSQELWGKDVHEFKPERFASKSYNPGRFMPFALGQRNCVGQSYAMMEAKIVLSMLISRFSLTISDTYRHAPIVVLTLKPKYGLQVCLKPIHP